MYPWSSSARIAAPQVLPLELDPGHGSLHGRMNQGRTEISLGGDDLQRADPVQEGLGLLQAEILGGLVFIRG